MNKTGRFHNRICTFLCLTLLSTFSNPESKADSPELTIAQLIARNSGAFNNLESCEIKTLERSTDSDTMKTRDLYSTHLRRNKEHYRCTSVFMGHEDSELSEPWASDEYRGANGLVALRHYDPKQQRTSENLRSVQAFTGTQKNKNLPVYMDPMQQLPFGVYIDSNFYKLNELESKIQIKNAPNKSNCDCYELIGDVNGKKFTVYIDPKLNYQIRKFEICYNLENYNLMFQAECFDYKNFGNEIYLTSRITTISKYSAKNITKTVVTTKDIEIISVNKELEQVNFKVAIPEGVQGFDYDSSRYFIWGNDKPSKTFKDGKEIAEWVGKNKKR